MGASNHVLTFTGGKVIFQIKFVYGIFHLVYGFPHIVGVAIRCNEMELRYIELGPQFINIFFSMQFKDIPWMGKCIEGVWINQMVCEQLLDFAPHKPHGKDAGVPHAIGNKDYAAWPGDADGF